MFFTKPFGGQPFHKKFMKKMKDGCKMSNTIPTV